MNFETTKRLTTVVLLVLAVAAIWYVKQIGDDRISITGAGTEKVQEVSGQVNDWENVTTGEEETEAAGIIDLNPELWEPESEETFFVEYRMQRDRVRANEIEMLNQMIENPEISAEGKKKAEEQLLALIELMEKELMIESMLKAQGYKDVVFFMRDGQVNVVVAAVALGEEEFMQIAEAVSTAAGVSLENISVTEHSTQQVMK
ncbi:MAG: SpoIIIAH-like family protein [Firmicutes bacterium]|nr:SpoIIIAH-like family protein [Bacillota bacterium]